MVGELTRFCSIEELLSPKRLHRPGQRYRGKQIARMCYDTPRFDSNILGHGDAQISRDLVIFSRCVIKVSGQSLVGIRRTRGRLMQGLVAVVARTSSLWRCNTFHDGCFLKPF